MKELYLPVVDEIISREQDTDLSRVRIIGSQHILETTHSMFRSLYRLGLKPQNVSLIGKCYSTCKEVYEEMIADGIDVSSDSFAYSSHVPFDKLYKEKIEEFIISRFKKCNANDWDHIIVLDDGGTCIQTISKHISSHPAIIAIEQTSAGYHAIRNSILSCPVINVARSPLKLSLESPMIAEAAAHRLYASLKSHGLDPERALILGRGAIGVAVQRRLENEMDITVYDVKAPSPRPGSSWRDLISMHRLIIGCTGRTSIPATHHHLLSPGTTLVSVSSSDREFDAVSLRKKAPINFAPHQNLMLNRVLLLNSGFPVNFDGERENIAPELIQLTIGLITAGILQGCEQNKSQREHPCIIPLCQQRQHMIDKFFKENLPLIEV